MNEMVEKMARAMWAKDNPQQAETGVAVGDMGGGWTVEQDLDLDWSLNRKAFMGLARAAIAAHEQALKEKGLVIVPREPTGGMKTAGRESLRQNGLLRPCWKAMTDAALQENGHES